MNKDGVTNRAVLEGLIKRARSKEKRAAYEAELNPPPPPACVLYLYSIYWRLRRRKGSNGFGPQAIEWTDIDAFMRLTGFSLSPWDVEILEDLDDLFLSAKSKPPE